MGNTRLSKPSRLPGGGSTQVRSTGEWEKKQGQNCSAIEKKTRKAGLKRAGSEGTLSIPSVKTAVTLCLCKIRLPVERMLPVIPSLEMS